MECNQNGNKSRKGGHLDSDRQGAQNQIGSGVGGKKDTQLVYDKIKADSQTLLD